MLPPVEKVFEAWTAIADGRVDLLNDEATVRSSDGAKTYTVRFNGDTYSSTDNATFWRGYPGYPVIAVMMLQHRLPFDASVAKRWAGINWTALNKKHRNNYAKAVAEVAAERGIDLEASMDAATKVMEALKAIPVVIKRKIVRSE